jgi:8-oxo-dGTP pyrophosphatase MutT (NUDIX family)
MAKVCRRALDAAGLDVADLNAFIPHQANMRITDAMARTLKLPDSVAIARDIADQGNTSAASIPLAMERMLEEGTISSGDKALLVLSRDRGWEPPGGYCDVDEFVIDGLKREVLEETGFVVEPLRLTGIYQCRREHSILSFVFLCTATLHSTTTIDESLDVKWWPLTSLSTVVTYPAHQLRLRDALNDEPGVRLTTYTIEPFNVDHSVVL